MLVSVQLPVGKMWPKSPEVSLRGVLGRRAACCGQRDADLSRRSLR